MTVRIYAEGAGEGELYDTLFPLRDYFGSDFRENQLRAWPRLEAVSKPTVLNALAQATAACTKRYAKGRVSFELLARLNPAVVEDACPHARLFLDQLRRI